ncbi:hypothetical protein B0H10DRAFT_2212228 [Mycena sp. CBHHK59/15]|nr:hypothetical protein B0H10DRAFT_2212228 [Mycena sp. CBHHK59/15]
MAKSRGEQIRDDSDSYILYKSPQTAHCKGHHRQHPLNAPTAAGKDVDVDAETQRVSRISQYLFPIGDPSRETSWITENQKTMQSLFACLDNSNCSQNQTKIVIVSSYHFLGALNGWNGGEDVWARSTTLALRNMGYSFLYSVNWQRTIQMYQTFPHLVAMIFAQSEETAECFADPLCLLSEENTDGIPAWKIFSFYWWSAYVMGKNSRYFATASRAWDPEILERASAATQIQFLAGTERNIPEFSNTIQNLGKLPRGEFYIALSKSVALVGMGLPETSPTPYDALCLGVPFINPIFKWDPNNISDQTLWDTQHLNLKYFDPPYVYVFAGDMEGFVQAIQDAIAHPIDSDVVDAMRMGAVQQRLGQILATDWRAEAVKVMKRRTAAGEGQLFTL